MWGLDMLILMLSGERRVESVFLVWNPWSRGPTLNFGDEMLFCRVGVPKIPAESTRGRSGSLGSRRFWQLQMPMMAPSGMDSWYRSRHVSSRAEILAPRFFHDYCLYPSASVSNSS